MIEYFLRCLRWILVQPNGDISKCSESTDTLVMLSNPGMDRPPKADAQIAKNEDEYRAHLHLLPKRILPSA